MNFPKTDGHAIFFHCFAEAKFCVLIYNFEKKILAKKKKHIAKSIYHLDLAVLDEMRVIGYK